MPIICVLITLIPTPALSGSGLRVYSQAPAYIGTTPTYNDYSFKSTQSQYFGIFITLYSTSIFIFSVNSASRAILMAAMISGDDFLSPTPISKGASSFKKPISGLKSGPGASFEAFLLFLAACSCRAGQDYGLDVRNSAKKLSFDANLVGHLNW
jgi:hypothetical protein